METYELEIKEYIDEVITVEADEPIIVKADTPKYRTMENEQGETFIHTDALKDILPLVGCDGRMLSPHQLAVLEKIKSYIEKSKQ